jgi:uncharacterized membrane protein YfcA
VMTAIVLIAIIGLIGGVLSGLFGIGGGLVIVPALILVAGFPTVTSPARMRAQRSPRVTGCGSSDAPR